MAHETNPEHPQRIDEETPLLVDPELQNNEEEVNAKSGENSNASWYAWRVFWVLVAALVIGVFVKGWIDAGSDVNVRSCLDCLMVIINALSV